MILNPIPQAQVQDLLSAELMLALLPSILSSAFQVNQPVLEVYFLVSGKHCAGNFAIGTL